MLAYAYADPMVKTIFGTIFFFGDPEQAKDALVGSEINVC